MGYVFCVGKRVFDQQKSVNPIVGLQIEEKREKRKEQALSCIRTRALEERISTEKLEDLKDWL